MNKFLWACVAVVALAVVAESLTCNTCSVGILNTCVFGSTATCSASEPNCYKGQATFNVSSVVNLYTKGCLASSSCNTTTTGNILGAGYTVSRTCCSTDRCNGASSIQLPLTAALGAALVALWSSRAF
ncbi:protein Bouncer-like [Osmerus eperlanus]|uniref:protein Bouncer-like n=1 Tax=Osmerus eperlanus TaxID=29151 RepID=UPI002E14A3B9